MGLMKKPKAPRPDPRIAEERAKQKRLEQERIAKEKKLQADEEKARRAGLRGARSLLSGGPLGYKFSDSDNSKLGS